MELIDLVKPGVSHALAFIGAGGKTSAMFRLARDLPGRVIASATTHLAISQLALADTHCIAESTLSVELCWNSAVNTNGAKVILFTGKPGADGRTAGLDEECMDRLHSLCQSAKYPLLIEADGARQKPLKAPDEHEPAIPWWVNTVVVTAGMTGLGKPLEESRVHRAKIFSYLSGLAIGAEITPEALAKMLTHPAGGLKNIPNDARRYALLNQADTPRLQALAREVADLIAPAFDGVIITSLKNS